MNNTLDILKDINFKNFLKNKILFSYEKKNDNMIVKYTILSYCVDVHIESRTMYNTHISLSYKDLFKFIKEYNIKNRKNKINYLVNNII